MDLTVCICTHDRPRYVRDCLDGLRRQSISRDRFSILLVDSASSPETAAELADLATQFNARLIRLDQPGVSLARNAGAWAARTQFIAYIDDDAIPATDWVACILDAILQPGRRPALIGGRILPKWEAPLPNWWPPRLRGVLSIIEHEGRGEYRTAAVPKGLEPYAANMVVHVLSLLATGGFGGAVGRYGNALLSDEEVQLAWTLQDAGYSVRYDFADHGAPPNPGPPAGACVAAVTPLLARRFDGSDTPPAATAGNRLARAPAPSAGRGVAGANLPCPA